MPSEPVPTVPNTPTVPERSKPEAWDTWPGLSGGEAREKLAQVGPNELSTLKPKPLVVQLLRYFTQPLVAILLIAALIAASLGIG